MVVQFIDDHRVRFGVQPICRVLTEHGCKIAPSTYYAHHARPASARSVSDVALLVEIRRVHSDRQLGRGLYGVRKVWHQLPREGTVVARCTVERLMKAAGLHGIRRGKPFITTRPDPAAVRPPDLVDRDFTASRPNQLWIVDFTYVATWSGMAFTANGVAHRDRVMAGRAPARRARQYPTPLLVNCVGGPEVLKDVPPHLPHTTSTESAP